MVVVVVIVIVVVVFGSIRPHPNRCGVCLLYALLSFLRRMAVVGKLLFETLRDNGVLDLANGEIRRSTATEYGDKWVRVPLFTEEVLQVVINSAWEDYAWMETPNGGDPGDPSDAQVPTQVWKNGGEPVRAYHSTLYTNLSQAAASVHGESQGGWCAAAVDGKTLLGVRFL